ncbi:hypothetical protein NE237_005977 [Protea cynaroides]|uniref:AAA+ ATPase domain-containing protein n=1 Tax=Protea cynaroides TaxID=273540 RepID=A0A9Q0KLI0_9MAGN|nr:hypothetical protein NE237_005977 [Protea cynaroides]
MEIKEMMMTGKLWTSLGSTAAALMVGWAMFQPFCPVDPGDYLKKCGNKLVTFFSPYIEIKFSEYTADRFKRSEVFSAIEAYLMSNSSKQAKRLKADAGKNSRTVVLSMDDQEEITEEFQGATFWWSSTVSHTPKFSYFSASDEKRYYILTFHKRYRNLVTDSYLNHVIEEGKAVGVRNQQRKLYTNNSSDNWHGYKKTIWSHVVFEHPSTFQTLAMDPKKKNEIMEDLITFKRSKDYYKKIGKAWKRGYLLYGPPGTGKSSMIAAIANLLDYDVYDLELTIVKNNTELRKLLIETSSKSIIVIEDIDCSLDLTGQRKKNKKKKEKDEKKEGEPKPDEIKEEEEKSKDTESKVTLSGLLNFIDGLWSAIGGEKLIIFTTNYVDQLDPALIRRGRMDKHIEMSYCNYEGFKVLAKNYLDLESDPLFDTIHGLLKDTEITPADVAENLMSKAFEVNSKECLEALISALQETKEKARLKAEEEAIAAATKEGEASTSTKEAAKETEEKESLTRSKDKEAESDLV